MPIWVASWSICQRIVGIGGEYNFGVTRNARWISTWRYGPIIDPRLRSIADHVVIAELLRAGSAAVKFYVRPYTTKSGLIAVRDGVIVRPSSGRNTFFITP